MNLAGRRGGVLRRHQQDCSAADINPIGGISKTVGGMVNDKNLIVIWCLSFIEILMIIGDHGSANLILGESAS